MRETLPKPFSRPSVEVGPAGLWGHGFGWLIGRQMCDDSNLSGAQEAPPLGGTHFCPHLVLSLPLGGLWAARSGARQRDQWTFSWL